MRLVPLVLAALVAATGCDLNRLGRHRATAIGELPLGAPPRVRFDQDLTAACGSGELTAAGRQVVARPPYLQRASPRGVWVLWTTGGAGGTVEVTRPDGTPVARVDAAPDDTVPLRRGTQWVARLDGLQPETLYCYRLRDPAGVALTARTGLRTAPPPGDVDPVRFAALGDVGTGSRDQRAVRRQLETVALDFVLISGDVGYPSGTSRQYDRHVFAVYAALMRSVPFFVAAGNHDYKTLGGRPFRQVFALPDNGGPEGLERWYSYDWGPVHVVVLDTERIGAAQARWLDADLAASARPWTVVVAHRPPFSSGVHGGDREVARVFVPLFERHGVDLVLSGHDHDYERLVPVNGVHYVVSGGGGRGVRPIDATAQTAFAQAVAHFVYVEVSPSRLVLWAIDATGAPFDSLALRADQDRRL